MSVLVGAEVATAGEVLDQWPGLVASPCLEAGEGLSAVSLPIPQFTLLAGIATYMPLVRYPLSTPALKWNRHR
jgi:hypothetical protein